jgi:hypothetical protein
MRRSIRRRGTAEIDVVQIATKQMNFGFQNHGVSGAVLSNPYLHGTATAQAREAAANADINLIFDDKTIHIWPKGGTRKGPIPVISPATGLVGYPKYTANGLDIRCLVLHQPWHASVGIGCAQRFLQSASRHQPQREPSVSRPATINSDPDQAPTTGLFPERVHAI